MPFHNSKVFRRKIKQLKRVRTTFARVKKDVVETAKKPIEASEKIITQIQKVEKMQQDDIDKEIELVKKGIDTEEINESSIKTKMAEILRQLPKNDKLRQLVDEKQLEKNVNLAKSKVGIKS